MSYLTEKLPLEIVDLIIDNLAQNDVDNASVKACSLTCRTLLPLCRKRIFMIVRLKSPLSFRDLEFDDEEETEQEQDEEEYEAPQVAHGSVYGVLGPLSEGSGDEADASPASSNTLSSTGTASTHPSKQNSSYEPNIPLAVWTTVSRIPVADLFVRLVTETPAIAEYVQGLDFELDKYTFDSFSPSLAASLKRLTKLKVLRLSNGTYAPIVDWGGMLPPLKSTLLHLIHLPTIETLMLNGINGFMSSDLAPCRHLRQLEFCMVDLAGNDPSASTSIVEKSARHSLWALHLMCYLDEFASLLLRPQGTDQHPILDLEQLKCVELGLDEPRDFSPAKEILGYTRCLQKICIWYTQWRDTGGLTAGDVISLIVPSLDTLHTFVIKYFIPAVGRDPFFGICEKLEQIAGTNRIEYLEIAASVNTDELCHTGNEWGKLEKILLAPGWDHLQRVDFDITIHSQERDDDGWLESALRRLSITQFPNLVSNKSFQFLFTVSEDRETFDD